MSLSLLSRAGPAPAAAPAVTPDVNSSTADDRRRAALQQTTLLPAFVRRALRSRRWRLGEVCASIGRLFRPPALSAADLVPWQQLRPADGAPGRWQSTGAEPQFLAAGYLPAGWLRVRLRMTGETVGRFGV